ncbi:MAG: Holliday junction resolvase RuvX [Synoicihabitans sp.]
MTKFIGIDPGSKRIGLARGDELGLATPLAALLQPDEKIRWQALLDVITREKADEIVLGYPLNMDDSVGPKAKESEKMASRLREELGIPVHLVDERLTSHEAEATVRGGDLRGIRASGVVDSRAAALILQDYLDLRYPPVLPEEDW